MPQIYQPKKSGGIMGSKATRLGIGFATGGPLGAGLALASNNSPAGQAAGLYGGYQAISNGLSKPDQPSGPVAGGEESYLGGSDYAQQLDPYGVSNSTYGIPALNRYKASKYGGG